MKKRGTYSGPTTTDVLFYLQTEYGWDTSVRGTQEGELAIDQVMDALTVCGWVLVDPDKRRTVRPGSLVSRWLSS